MWWRKWSDGFCEQGGYVTSTLNDFISNADKQRQDEATDAEYLASFDWRAVVQLHYAINQNLPRNSMACSPATNMQGIMSPWPTDTCCNFVGANGDSIEIRIDHSNCDHAIRDPDAQDNIIFSRDSFISRINMVLTDYPGFQFKFYWEVRGYERVQPIDGKTITFDVDGGIPITSQYIESGENAVNPGDAVKDGYTFIGWYPDRSSNVEYDFDTPVTENITIYAKFVLRTQVTVTLELNGGTITGSTTIQMYAGDRLTLSRTPNKELYDFVEWATDSTLSSPFANNSRILTDTTLYARWSVRQVDWSNLDPGTLQVGDILPAPTADGFGPIYLRVVDIGNVPVKDNSGYTHTATLQTNILTTDTGNVFHKCYDEDDRYNIIWRDTPLKSWANEETIPSEVRGNFLGSFLKINGGLKSDDQTEEGRREWASTQAFLDMIVPAKVVQKNLYKAPLSVVTVTTEDKVWIPSTIQIGSGAGAQPEEGTTTNACSFDYYSDYSVPPPDKYKAIANAVSGHICYWLTRTQYDTNNWYDVCGDGTVSSTSVRTPQHNHNKYETGLSLCMTIGWND